MSNAKFPLLGSLHDGGGREKQTYEQQTKEPIITKCWGQQIFWEGTESTYVGSKGHIPLCCIFLDFVFGFFFLEHCKMFQKRKPILAFRLQENRLLARCGLWGRSQPTADVVFPVMKSATKSNKAK